MCENQEVKEIWDSTCVISDLPSSPGQVKVRSKQEVQDKHFTQSDKQTVYKVSFDFPHVGVWPSNT